MPIVSPAEYQTLPKDLVLVGGCFDPLHPGHLSYFDVAASFGPLCCAVASDETIQRLKGRPALLPQAERMELIAALHQIDFVVAQDESGEAGVLEDLRPKFYAKGKGWLDCLPDAETKACAQFGIPALFLDGANKDSSGRRLREYQQALDEQAVARLEALIQRQKPASEPWQPVTDYSFEARKAIEGQQPQLILDHLLQCEDADVLDYGCGPNAILVRLLREASDNTQVHVVGYDPQISGSGAWLDRGKVYDLVICREVLEHLTLRRITDTIRDLVALSAGLIYVTTRLAADPAHLLAVDESDALDPTHITMLSKPFLRTLFLLEGCTSRHDLEAKMDWKGLGRCLVMEVPHV